MRTNKLFQWYSLLIFGLMSVNAFGTGFSDNHNDGVLNGWTRHGNRQWSESNGKARPANAVGDWGFLINDYNTTNDGVLEVTATTDQWNGNRGGVVFRWTSTSSYYYVAVLPGNEWSNSITFCKNSMDLTTGTVVASAFQMGTTFTLKVVIEGSTFKFYIDNVLRGQITDASLPSGKVGYCYSAEWNSYISFDNIVWTDQQSTSYQLTTSASGNGSVSPASGTFPEGESVTLTATPDVGWAFDHWSGDASGSENPVTVTMDADKNITANFVQITHSLTTTVDGNGTVTPASGDYTYGESVEITATPAQGWVFDHWSGDASGSENPVTITMDADKNITAHFTQITFSLTTTVDGNGTVTPASGTFTEGESVEITATPAQGWVFDHWSGDASGSENPVTVIMDANKSITAHFTQITHELTVAVSGEGTVSPSSGIFPQGEIVEITATAETGWRFDSWGGDVSSTENPLSVRMDSDISITATFVEVPTFSLIATADGNGTISPASGTFSEGEDVIVTATPDQGWRFDHWSGDVSGTENPVTVTMNADKIIVAHFIQVPTYSLSVTVNGSGSVSPESGIFTENENVTLTATPEAGWIFDRWSGDTTGTSNPMTIIMDSEKNIVAHFVEYVPSVPNSAKLSITAKLYDSEGNLVGIPAPTTVDAVIKLYSQETAGLLKYTETFLQSDNMGIAVERGYFIARLGEGATSDDLAEVLADNPHLWVEISIDGEALNRVPLTGAAYLLSSRP